MYGQGCCEGPAGQLQDMVGAAEQKNEVEDGGQTVKRHGDEEK
jgi:hypothetical protein